MVAETSSRRLRKREQTRAHLLRTAISLMEERGFDALTVEAIADAADVGKGTIYNYFQTKEDIVVAFFVDLERSVQARMGRWLAGRTERPASLEAILVDFLRYQFRLKEPHYRFVRIFFAQMFARTEQMFPYIVELQTIIDPPLVQLFSALQNDGLLRPDTPMQALVLHFKTVHFGLSATWALEGPPWRGTKKTLPEQVHLFCQGMGVHS